jgi:hypothetical protein
MSSSLLGLATEVRFMILEDVIASAMPAPDWRRIAHCGLQVNRPSRHRVLHPGDKSTTLWPAIREHHPAAALLGVNRQINAEAKDVYRRLIKSPAFCWYVDMAIDRNHSLHPTFLSVHVAAEHFQTIQIQFRPAGPVRLHTQTERNGASYERRLEFGYNIDDLRHAVCHFLLFGPPLACGRSRIPKRSPSSCLVEWPLPGPHRGKPEPRPR